jgi:hypothetical protein
MEEFNWDLFEQDQSNFDQVMERAAFENTYLILTGKVTYESLLEKQSMQISNQFLWRKYASKCKS